MDVILFMLWFESPKEIIKDAGGSLDKNGGCWKPQMVVENLIRLENQENRGFLWFENWLFPVLLRGFQATVSDTTRRRENSALSPVASKSL